MGSSAAAGKPAGGSGGTAGQQAAGGSQVGGAGQTSGGGSAQAGDAGASAGQAGAAGAGGACIGSSDPRFRRVFLTTKLFTGNLGGVEGAHSACQAIADERCLGGLWAAWVSDAVWAPATNFKKSSVPYQLLNGIEIAKNWDDLVDGTPLQHAINVTDETKEIASNDIGAWTGTDALGKLIPAKNCDDWKTDDSGKFGKVGTVIARGDSWTFSSDVACAEQQFLYCFEQ